MKEFKGIIPAMITPLDKNNDVNRHALEALVRFFTKKGVDGFYLCGSNGEGLLLDAAKRKKVTEIVRECADKDKIIITHVGAMDTSEVQKLARHARDVGVDAVSSIPPLYYPLDIRSIFTYYEIIAKAAEDLPLIIYNIPETTGITIDEKKTKELLKIEIITGIKYSDNNMAEMRKIKDLKNGDFKVFFGQDGMFASGLLMGADGGIGGSYNIMPGMFLDIYRHMLENDWISAARVQHDIIGYRKIYAKYGKQVSTFKRVLSHILGIDMGSAAPPLPDLSPEESGDMISELDKAGFFDING